MAYVNALDFVEGSPIYNKVCFESIETNDTVDTMGFGDSDVEKIRLRFWREEMTHCKMIHFAIGATVPDAVSSLYARHPPTSHDEVKSILQQRFSFRKKLESVLPYTVAVPGVVVHVINGVTEITPYRSHCEYLAALHKIEMSGVLGEIGFAETESAARMLFQNNACEHSSEE